jgi:small subunit ribosomal protein S18
MADNERPTSETSQAPAAAPERRPWRPESREGDRPRSGGGGYRGGDRDDRGGDRGDRGGDRGGGRRRRFQMRKVCQFCVEKMHEIDYKDIGRLRFYVTDRGKIRSRRLSGACAKHQRQITTAIKRARNLALLPFKA